MSRRDISEERANGMQSKHWCGAANWAPSVCDGKCVFLFQFCTTPRAEVRVSRLGLKRRQALMALAFMLMMGISVQLSEGCKSPCVLVVMRCPGCAGIDSEVFNALRSLPYGSHF